MTRAEFNRFCKSLPAATHVVQWGGSDVWKVGGKVFAICGDDYDGVPGITFKVSDLGYEILQSEAGLRPAPYLASRGLKWIQRHEKRGPGVREMRAHLAASHTLVVAGLTKKARAEIGLAVPAKRTGARG
jgi:predicted DNA-binding protein (MmcQ/YjbR family)